MLLQPPPKTAAEAGGEQRDQEQHQRDEEHDFGDADRGAGDAAEAEHAGDQRDDKQGDDETEHLSAPQKFQPALQLATARAGSAHNPIGMRPAPERGDSTSGATEAKLPLETPSAHSRVRGNPAVPTVTWGPAFARTSGHEAIQ